MRNISARYAGFTRAQHFYVKDGNITAWTENLNKLIIRKNLIKVIDESVTPNGLKSKPRSRWDKEDK